MPEIPESLRTLFETPLTQAGDEYVISVPEELVERGGLDVDTNYRVAILEGPSEDDVGQHMSHIPPEGTTDETTHPEPPVTEGEERTVTIDTLGDQGDGIARVERGFIVIVPDTKPGDEVSVEVTEVKETVAFGETIDEPTVR